MLERPKHIEDFQMDRADKFKYYVIKFLELPYKDIDDYVCVPWSWIIIRRKKDGKIIVSYPVENPTDTAKRVKRRQKRSEDWKVYLAVQKYGTDSYEDAKMRKMDFMYYENKCSHMKKRDQELSAPVKKKTRRPKRSKVVEPTESDSDAAEQPNQAFECLSENQPLPTREDFPMQNSCSSEISVEESDDRSCVEKTEHAENITPKQPSVNQNFSNLTNSLSNPNLTLSPAFCKDLFTVLRNLHTVSANSYSLVSHLRKTIIDNTEAMRDVKQLIADSRSSNSDITTKSPSAITTAEVDQISEKNQSKQQKPQEEYDGHGDDDTGEVSKKRRQKRTFVFPPEYDKNDSRWTLKHRKSALGLEELMPHTNVYVNSLGLSKCKRLSKDCKSLARMLLVEIFTKSALSVCSLTGTRARAYNVVGASVRPGLDENARTVLLSYVEEYGCAKHWITVDTASIQNSIRNKMQEFRFKYG